MCCFMTVLSLMPFLLPEMLFFKFFFFLCGPVLKSLLNLLQYCFCFMFWFLVWKAHGILAPQPGIEPTRPAVEREV